MSKGKKDKLDLPTILNSVINEIMVQDPSQTFYHPVDTKRFFDYTKKISKPMDLQTMQKKTKKYVGYKEFEADLNLIWSNCRIYNQENSDIYKMSLRLEKFAKKCLKEYLLPFKSSYRFDEKGIPIKKRKYNRVKDGNGGFTQQDSASNCVVNSSAQNGSSRKSSLGNNDKKIDRRTLKGVLKLGKVIQKGKKSDQITSANTTTAILKKNQNINNNNNNINAHIAGQHVLLDKKPAIHAAQKGNNYNCIVIGLQQQMQSKENFISDDDKLFLKEKVKLFSQEELFKCIKTIQEYEPAQITQSSKELYSVNLNTITKMTFNKIKEQFAL